MGGMIGIVPNPNVWLNTRNTNIEYVGLQTLLRNQVAGQFFGTTGTDGMGVEFRIRAHVSLRGRRVDPGLVPGFSLDPAPERRTGDVDSHKGAEEDSRSRSNAFTDSPPVYPTLRG